MRKVTMVRLGIAAAITCLGGLGALASGCTSDDNTGQPLGRRHKRRHRHEPERRTAAARRRRWHDGRRALTRARPSRTRSFDPSSTPPPAFARTASRIATATGTAAPSVAPIAAIPDSHGSAPPWNAPPAYGPGYNGGVGAVAPGTPGLYPGTIAAVPDITTLAQFAITPYVIDANLIANNTADGGPDRRRGAHLRVSSSGRTAAAALPRRARSSSSPTVPSGTFKDGTTWLLSATGCLPGFEPSTLGQGASITAGGHLRRQLRWCGAQRCAQRRAAPLDTTTVAADGGWGVQFAQRSSAIEGTPFPIPEGETTHPAASARLLPGFIESVTVTLDAGSDDAGDAGPTTITTQTFAPLGATPDTLAERAPRSRRWFGYRESRDLSVRGRHAARFGRRRRAGLHLVPDFGDGAGRRDCAAAGRRCAAVRLGLVHADCTDGLRIRSDVHVRVRWRQRPRRSELHRPPTPTVAARRSRTPRTTVAECTSSRSRTRSRRFRSSGARLMTFKNDTGRRRRARARRRFR